MEHHSDTREVRRGLVNGPFAWLLLVFVSTLAFYGAATFLGFGPGGLGTAERSTIDIFHRSSPSVVHIESRAVGGRRLDRDPMSIALGSGSGFIWGDDGYIVTNYHVIAAGNQWRVTLQDRSRHLAQLVGQMPGCDLAVLKIDVPEAGVQPTRVGDSKTLLVGQDVLAIGNPFGMDQTLTTGVISGLGRRMKSISGDIIEDVIQIDASINPGNSGGPLFDSRGCLIGVNTAIGDEILGRGIGFAVPVSTVNRVVPWMIDQSELLMREGARAGLGVRVGPMSFTDRFGIEGVVVEDVVPGSAGERAGLRSMVINRDGVYVFDLLTSIDNVSTRTSHDLLMALGMHKPGDLVFIQFERGGTTQRAEVTLDTLPSR
ncbi:MAG: S1-C subfamily serine protease [Planctomycetota bacterium]|jgi:S1-C subfamily serine protease